jgi:hypothetical protein
MNFQQVIQNKGIKGDDGYDIKTDMFGIFTEIGGITSSRSGKQTCACKVMDGNGEKHTVHFYGNTLPTRANLNQRSLMSISAFDGQGQKGPYVGYQAFWSPAASQNPPQNSPQTPQSTTAPKTGNNTQNCSFALSYAKDLVVADKVAISEIFRMAKEMKQFLDTGEEPYVSEDEEEIPFP